MDNYHHMGVITYRIKGKIASKQQWNEYVKENTTVSNSKQTKFNVTLPNGLELNGTLDQLKETAAKLDFKLEDLFSPKEYYLSSTHGPLKISEMQTQHLINAANKLLPDWTKDVVKSSKYGKDFVDGLMSWRGIDNHLNLLAMIHELNQRTNK